MVDSTVRSTGRSFGNREAGIALKDLTDMVSSLFWDNIFEKLLTNALFSICSSCVILTSIAHVIPIRASNTVALIIRIKSVMLKWRGHEGKSEQSI